MQAIRQNITNALALKARPGRVTCGRPAGTAGGVSRDPNSVWGE